MWAGSLASKPAVSTQVHKASTTECQCYYFTWNVSSQKKNRTRCRNPEETCVHSFFPSEFLCTALAVLILTLHTRLADQWSWTQLRSAYFCLRSAGLKACTTTPGKKSRVNFSSQTLQRRQRTGNPCVPNISTLKHQAYPSWFPELNHTP